MNGVSQVVMKDNEPKDLMKMMMISVGTRGRYLNLFSHFGRHRLDSNQ